MGLFDSPRQRAGEDASEDIYKSYDDILKSINGLQSSYGGIGNAGDVKKRFGIGGITPGGYKSTISQIYDPLRRNLQTQRSQRLASVASRMGNVKAPQAETFFAPVEAQASDAMGALESSAGSATLQAQENEQSRMDQQQALVASILNDALGKQDSFSMNKQGLSLQGLGGKMGALQAYLASLSDASTFDDILALGGTASKFVRPFKI